MLCCPFRFPPKVSSLFPRNVSRPRIEGAAFSPNPNPQGGCVLCDGGKNELVFELRYPPIPGYEHLSQREYKKLMLNKYELGIVAIDHAHNRIAGGEKHKVVLCLL